MKRLGVGLLWLATCACFASMATAAGESAKPAPSDAPATATPADEAAKATPSDEVVYKQWLKRVRLIEIRHLRSGRPSQVAEGRKQILAIEDEAAVGPMVDVLYNPKPQYRSLLIEALAAMASDGSKAAQAYLQEMAVGDVSAGHRRRAIEGLKATGPDPPTDRLLAHLALDDVAVLRDRAATALAALDDRRAVWLLVERLVTEDVRLVGGKVRRPPLHIDIRTRMVGVPTFRRVPWGAIGPDGEPAAFIELPEVAAIDAATPIPRSDRPPDGPRYERVWTKHPRVLAALKTLTGKDFGYDEAAWRKWLKSAEAEKVVPPWKPVRLKK